MTTNTRITAHIYAHKYDADGTTSAEHITLNKKEFPTKTTAHNWIKKQLNKPTPPHLTNTWAQITQEEPDPTDGIWITTQETDPITKHDTQPPHWTNT